MFVCEHCDSELHSVGAVHWLDEKNKVVCDKSPNKYRKTHTPKRQ